MNGNDFVKEHGFSKPEIDEVDYLLDKVIKDCKKNFFNGLTNRWVHETKFRNVKNKEKVILNISHDCLEFESNFCGLNRKNQKAKDNKIQFDELLRLTRHFYSILSNTILCYYLKLLIPIMHR